MDKPIIVIDRHEFEEAQRDPKVIARLEQARRYAQKLIDEGGHCTKCLVINCEHICRLPKDHWTNMGKVLD